MLHAAAWCRAATVEGSAAMQAGARTAVESEAKTLGGGERKRGGDRKARP
ncbi:hypothetical protein PPN31114_00954 [Pandoraea pneumonica]|uniref:Uncharacterized protein n=1 Tax=Pandoraea pneumonica TaxID=2508299 RepID=A0A5E4SR28_9BURK|nr:hypothetical protein PPN31114_00954 [Pandoraea pneumonica]